MKTLVVSELASAHDGSLAKAERLVDVAIEAGADVAKIQYFHDPDKMAARRKVPDYYRDVYRRYNVPLDWLPILRDRAHTGGLQFCASVFLPEAVEVVRPYVDILKGASFEALDQPLLDALDATTLPVIVSTGMCDHAETHRLLRWRNDRRGRVGRRPNLLLCVSQYPATLNSLNLAALRHYGLDGLSDHTANLCAGMYAVLAGARIVETHIRLDGPDGTDPANPDYAPALPPTLYRWYIENIRQAEAMLGAGQRTHQPAEDWARQYRVVQP